MISLYSISTHRNTSVVRDGKTEMYCTVCNWSPRSDGTELLSFQRRTRKSFVLNGSN